MMETLIICALIFAAVVWLAPWFIEQIEAMRNEENHDD